MQCITIPAGNHGVFARPRADAVSASANLAVATNIPPSSQPTASAAKSLLPPSSQLDHSSHSHHFMSGAPPLQPMRGPLHPSFYPHLSGAGLPVYLHPPVAVAPTHTGSSYLPAPLFHRFLSSPPAASPPVKAKAQDTKGKSVARAPKLNAAAKGRKPGSKGYSDMEKLLLAKLVRKLKPIGLDRWKRVTAAYNKHAEKHNFASRETKDLRSKFESVSTSPSLW